MSLIRSKFHQGDLYRTFESTDSSEKLAFPKQKRYKSQNADKKTSFTHSKTLKPEHIQFSPLLKNLKKREVLVQCENIQKARNLKAKLIDPNQLQKEYNKIIERYKNVKIRYTMRPCKIPRSGIDIYNEGKKATCMYLNSE